MSAFQRCHFIIFWSPCFWWKLTCHSYHCSPICNMAFFHWLLSRFSPSWVWLWWTWVWFSFILLEFNEGSDSSFDIWLLIVSSPTVPSCLKSERVLARPGVPSFGAGGDFKPDKPGHTHECHRSTMPPISHCSLNSFLNQPGSMSCFPQKASLYEQ